MHPPDREPEQALATGRWVKLITGASNEDLWAIEVLAGIYSLAGVHCLDVAADPAVAEAARRGIRWARRQASAPDRWKGDRPPSPWLMVSLSDGEDPHFRKAWFDPDRCPAACPRPCERVCPAAAIPPAGHGRPGVVSERCYGCGRCLPLCPHGLIEGRHHVMDSDSIAPLLASIRPDAVEIHTALDRREAFARRVHELRTSGLELARVGVSCGLAQGLPRPVGGGGAGSVSTRVKTLAEELWQRFEVLKEAGFAPLWQLDGRPMSGDLGAGTAHAAVDLLERIAALAPPGPLQLAGGTNGHTHPHVLGVLQRHGRWFPPGRLAGVAFGGAARRLLLPLIEQAERRGGHLLEDPELWPAAVAQARSLIAPWLRGPAPTPR